MKKIASILSAAAIACMCLTSCSSLSTTVTSLVGTLLGGGSDDDSDIFGTGSSSDSHFLFIVMNTSSEDIYWFVPKNGHISNIMDTDLAQYLHPLAADDLDVYKIKDGSSDPIWTYSTDSEMPVYFFKASVIESNDWKNIVDNQMWEAVYKYTATQMIDAGKIVAYPAK